MRESEQAKVPVRGVSDAETTPVTASSGGLWREAGQFDVAETVEGEAGLPDFWAGALADVGVGGGGFAEVGGVEGAVGVEHFGVAEGDGGAGGGGDFEADDADHVLAEVEGPVAGGGLGEGDGL